MDQLKTTLDQLSIPWDDSKIATFEQYRKSILEWNEKVNLTAVKDPEEFERKHFADSLFVVGHPGFQNASTIIDVGTGAGFPGVPLAICFPEKKFVLLDSVQKKIRILQLVTEELGISNVKPISGRAEDLARDPAHRENYDLCLSRAVANLATLSEYCLPFVAVGGYFAAYKTESVNAEQDEAGSAIRRLGGRLEEVITYVVDDTIINHNILWINKWKATPKEYPRKAGTPSRDPIR
ncbi:MAG: 16S rRNA (guanine(527)-N(7))-methyltransferase RsmG [Firmicutes bacterium HGW-Firmicutes-11]|jgi:16S rRNA (guanine527-N7)-methyltransferase|nr:MAG: 16S rRNA (guanine(527)-N(7))-methyltransferase RsmG [Firmicutes bacterium HGW-Firmicutes-11]